MLGRFRTSFEVLRPRVVARTHTSVDTLLAGERETRGTLKQLLAGHGALEAGVREVLARLDTMSGEVRALQQQVSALTLRESQLNAIVRADAALDDAIAALKPVLDE